MSSAQVTNTLSLVREGIDMVFPIREADFNWEAEQHGVELTLVCTTRLIPKSTARPISK